MKITEVVTRALKIILIPSHQWKEVKSYDDSMRELLWGYAFPLVMLSAVGRTIGLLFDMVPFLGWSLRLIFVLAFNLVAWVTIPYLLMLLAGYILNFILPKFSISTNLMKTLGLVVYSFTSLYVLTFIVYLHPILRILIPTGIYIFLVYIFYVFWTGVKELFDISLEKKIGFVVVMVAVMIGSIFVVQHLYGMAFDLIFPGMAAYVK